ncbi:MAG TPA: hypothetical protein VEP72_08950 [Microbacterium sp.]|nr:hypothetical protein [Microbacterium sp.]
MRTHSPAVGARTSAVRITTALVTAALAAGALTACAPEAPMSDPTPTASTRPPFQTTTPGPIGPTGTPVAVPDARWDAIVADLEARGVTASPALVSAEAVVFNDGSLGCASPGQSYTQAQVDGMRVIVTADGQTYDYRFGTTDDPKLCTR